MMDHLGWAAPGPWPMSERRRPPPRGGRGHGPAEGLATPDVEHDGEEEEAAPVAMMQVISGPTAGGTVDHEAALDRRVVVINRLTRTQPAACMRRATRLWPTWIPAQPVRRGSEAPH